MTTPFDLEYAFFKRSATLSIISYGVLASSTIIIGSAIGHILTKKGRKSTIKFAEVIISQQIGDKYRESRVLRELPHTDNTFRRGSEGDGGVIQVCLHEIIHAKYADDEIFTTIVHENFNKIGSFAAVQIVKKGILSVVCLAAAWGICKGLDWGICRYECLRLILPSKLVNGVIEGAGHRYNNNNNNINNNNIQAFKSTFLFWKFAISCRYSVIGNYFEIPSGVTTSIAIPCVLFRCTAPKVPMYIPNDVINQTCSTLTVRDLVCWEALVGVIDITCLAVYKATLGLGMRAMFLGNRGRTVINNNSISRLDEQRKKNNTNDIDDNDTMEQRTELYNKVKSTIIMSIVSGVGAYIGDVYQIPISFIFDDSKGSAYHWSALLTLLAAQLHKT